MIFQTDRLIIRKAKESDAPHLHRNYSGDTNSSRFLSRRTHADVATTLSSIRRWRHGYLNRTSRLLVLVIEHRSLREAIGQIAFRFERGFTELHFGFSQQLAGHGLGTELCASALRHLHRAGFNRVRSFPSVEHHAFVRVLQKCGFQQSGVLTSWLRFPQLADIELDCVDMRANMLDLSRRGGRLVLRA